MKTVVKILLSFILLISIGLPITLESTQAAEQQWIEIPDKTTTDVKKPWTITFSNEVDPQSVNASTLFIKDTSGHPLELNTPVINGKQIIITPKQSYIPGNTYTIYLIGVKSKTGKTLKDTKFNFYVESSNTAPKVVSTIPEQSLKVGENISLNLNDYFKDLDLNDSLTFSASKGIVNGASWTYQSTKEIVDNVTITATDKAGQQVSSTFNIVVKSAAQEDTLYNAIYNALVNVEPELDVSRFTTKSGVAFDTLTKILEDHPEIYYFEYKGSLFWSNGRFELKYRYSKSQILAMNNQIENIATKIISENITPGMSDFEKVKAIHDYVVLNTAYDYDNYLRGTVPESSYDIDGLLLDGIAVCDGYAKTMVYLLNKIDIPVLYVTGKAGGDLHAWNKVQIDGIWYSLDATWNDPTPNKEGYVRYNYFLIPDNVLDDNHSWDDSDFPDATDTRYLFMADMWAFDLYDGYYYYSNGTDDIKIYKIKTDGTSKQKISAERANELVVYEGWIYFSNYSRSGYLYKMKTDGTQLTKLNDFHVVNLERNGTTLTYLDKQGKAYKYEIK